MPALLGTGNRLRPDLRILEVHHAENVPLVTTDGRGVRDPVRNHRAVEVF